MRNSIATLINIFMFISVMAQENSIKVDEIQRLQINSSAAEIFPRFWKDGLVFSSNRGIGEKSSGNFDFYVVSDTADQYPKKLRGKLRSGFNETSPFLSKNGNELYFSRNDFDKNFAKREWPEKIPLKSFKAVKKGKRWTKVRELPFNSNTYSVAHIVLNESENKIYFVSDMPGGYGGMDIYEADINKDGSFGEAINLGSRINTEKNETSPFIIGDSLLYFASESHGSMGGLDIFMTGIEDGEITNMGEPFNTPSNDYALVIDMDKNMTYFASNRNNEDNDDDIYYVKFSIQEEEEEEIIEEKSIVENSLVNSQATYGNHEENEVENYKLDTDFTKLQKIILFKFDSSVVQLEYTGSLDKMAAFLKKHTTVQVSLIGHTDHIGDSKYNQALSIARAESVKNYLADKGILTSRIQIEGKGENAPIEEYGNCSKERLKKNRRVEIFMDKN